MSGTSFSGGEKMEAFLRDLADKVTKPGTLRVGFLEGSTYPDGTSVPLVAVTNEFGRTVRSKSGDYYQLPRPFFRGMIATKKGNWPISLGNLLKRHDYDVDASFKEMGEGIKGQLQQAIRDYVGPPLAPATIKAKGFDKQLIDTGYMLNSVNFEVKS